MNKVKQLGLAMLHYESKFNYLPNNRGWGLKDEGENLDTRGYSWITQILPYIEGVIIYDRIKTNEVLSYKDTSPNGIQDNLLAAQQIIAALKCPSDTYTGITVNSLMYSNIPNTAVGSANYKACCGANWKHSVDPNSLAFKPNVPPTPPLPPTIVTAKTYQGRNKNKDLNDGRDNGNGIICRNFQPSSDPNKPSDIDKPILTAMVDIRDGASHTFAIGEVVVGASNYNGWYWFNGTTATCALPLNYKNPSANPQNPNDWTYTYGFQSRHAVGANFCMCDGSVKFIANDIDLTVYQAQATICGGELFNDD